MAPRALGALFALVAALAFALALAGGLLPATVPGWWDGHPTVQGKELERKALHVGVMGAVGCNFGEEVTCETVPTGHTAEFLGVAEAGLLGLGIVTALMTAFSVWKMFERRKLFGKLLLFETLVIAGGAVAIFLRGPDLQLKQQIGIPVGLGFYSVIGGAALAFFGGLIAMRVMPEPLRLKSSEPRIPTPQPYQGMRVSNPHMMPPSPGGPLPGPGPLAGPMGFEHQNLRPLYEQQQAPPPPMMPPPLEAPTPHAYGDAASAHVPLAPYVPPPPYSPPRMTEQTEDIERHSESSLLAEDPFEVAPPPAPAPRNVAPAPDARAAAARVGAMPRAQRPSMPPARPTPPSKHPTLAAPVPPPPPRPPAPPPDAERTGVEIDAEAKAAAAAAHDRPSDLAMTVPVDRMAENFEDGIETRDANKLLGLAETEVAQSYRPVENARMERPRAPSTGEVEAPTAFPPPPAAKPLRDGPPAPWGASSDPADEAPTAFKSDPVIEPPKPVESPKSVAAMNEAPMAFAPATPKSATVPPPNRSLKPSVPFAIPAIGAPPSQPIVAAANGKLAEPKPATSTMPFATIPSPFGKPMPSKPDEAVTRTTPKKRADSEQPTAHVPRSEPDIGDTADTEHEHEAPTRAVGGNPPGVGLHNTSTSAGPDPDIAPPRRWRASSEVATSHSGNSTTDEPTGRPSETTLRSPPKPAGDARSPLGDQVAGTIPDHDAHEAPTVSARDGEPRRPTTNRAADVPVSTAPTSLPPPKKAPQISSGPTPACPQCEAPMAWVEEHLRFYCSSCRMYF